MRLASILRVLACIACILFLGFAGAPRQAHAQRLAITGVRAYPAADAAPIEDAVILIDDGRIRAVGSSAVVPIPRDYRRIDRPGAVALAGFWNSHVHLITPVLLRASTASDRELEDELSRAFTKWGFTTVFDLASTSAIAGEVESRVRSGRVRGPRILSVAAPFYPSGATPVYARPFYEAFALPSAEIASVGSAARRIRQQVGRGADGIKLFTGSIVGGEQGVVHMPLSTVTALAREARAQGVPVFAHPTDREGLERAVQGGAHILAHAAPLMGAWTADYARWIADAGVAMVPTLSLFELSPHPATPVDVAVAQVAALHQAGGTILFGTDAGFVDFFDTRAELRLLASALGWRGVLDSLTTAPARIFGESHRRGRIAPGFVADLVLVDGDPAEDVENLARIRTVIKAGDILHEEVR